MNGHCRVILVNYRDAALIAGAVRSVLADAPQADVCVVDNSDDDAHWAALQAVLPPAVQRLRAPGNIGFGRACNLALQDSPAECFALVNPDVRLLPGCLGTLQQALHDDPSLGAVGPRQYLDDGLQWLLPISWMPTAIRSWATDKALRDAKSRQRLVRAARHELLRYWRADAPIRQRALSGGALMVHRRALAADRLLFDPRYFMYFEDSDLCVRLRHAHWGLACVPAAQAVHAWRNEAHKHPLMEAGAALFFGKHYAPDDAWLARLRQLSILPCLPFEGPTLSLQDGCPSLSVVVPEEWHPAWLLEASPSPLLQPSVSQWGQGATAELPRLLLDHLGPGPVYCRLSPVFQQTAPALWIHHRLVSQSHG